MESVAKMGWVIRRRRKNPNAKDRHATFCGVVACVSILVDDETWMDGWWRWQNDNQTEMWVIWRYHKGSSIHPSIWAWIFLHHHHQTEPCCSCYSTQIQLGVHTLHGASEFAWDEHLKRDQATRLSGHDVLWRSLQRVTWRNNGEKLWHSFFKLSIAFFTNTTISFAWGFPQDINFELASPLSPIIKQSSYNTLKIRRAVNTLEMHDQTAWKP